MMFTILDHHFEINIASCLISLIAALVMFLQKLPSEWVEYTLGLAFCAFVFAWAGKGGAWLIKSSAEARKRNNE
jgi:hypothetical protein